MTLHWILVFAFLGAGVLGDDSCPETKEIQPCTCDGEGLNCMRAKTVGEIKKAFQAKFKYGGVRSVWIQGTPIIDIPDGLFGNCRSQQFYIEVNNVTTVNMNAFTASRKSLAVLSLFGNKIRDFPFGDLSVFENLGTLNLGRNQITTIGNNAFKSRSLSGIILAQNKISHIGQNAFSGLTSLTRLELSMNDLKVLGPLSFAFQRHSASLQISVAANQISSVSETAFEGCTPQAFFLGQNRMTSLPYSSFGALVTRMGNNGGYIDVTSNPFSCTGCDYSWLVTNKDSLEGKVLGLQCTDNRRTLRDLTKDNINCAN